MQKTAQIQEACGCGMLMRSFRRKTWETQQEAGSLLLVSEQLTQKGLNVMIFEKTKQELVWLALFRVLWSPAV